MKFEKKNVFLSGKHCDLFGLDSATVNLSDWFSWFNDEELTKDMDQHQYPNTKETQLEYFKQLSPTNLILGIGNKVGDFCGIVSLNQISMLHGRAEHSQLINPKIEKNPLVTIESNHLIFKHAFENLRIETVYGGSINLEKTKFMRRFYGFESDGIRPNFVFKKGKFHDIHLISLKKDDYMKHEKIHA